MKVRWSTSSLSDLRAIQNHVALDDKAAALRTVTAIVAQVETLTEFPRLGRKGRVTETLEFIVPRLPYIIAYQLAGQTITILALLHMTRRWPEEF